MPMNTYKLVLVGDSPNSERSGYVYCGTDEQACTAARALLQFHLEHHAVYAYEGDRLVCEIVRDRPCAGVAR